MILFRAFDDMVILNATHQTIAQLWDGICDEAELSMIDRSYLWRRQFVNDYAFEGYVDGVPKL